jgi:hypothetical protein
MAQTVIPTDLYVAGGLSAKSFTPPAGSITDAAVQTAAGIQASKLDHQYQPIYQQESSTNAVSERRVVHAVKGATATVVAFDAGAVVPLTGNDTCTIDLWKNGASILTAPIALANTDTARQIKNGSLSSTSAVAGDVFEVRVVYTHNTGTAPQGVFARLTLQEDAQ